MLLLVNVLFVGTLGTVLQVIIAILIETSQLLIISFLVIVVQFIELPPFELIQAWPLYSGQLIYVRRHHLRLSCMRQGKKFIGEVFEGGHRELRLEILSLFLEELRVAGIGALALVSERKKTFFLALFNLLFVAFLVLGLQFFVRSFVIFIHGCPLFTSHRESLCHL